jgi:hypothetical protein
MAGKAAAAEAQERRELRETLREFGMKPIRRKARAA